MERLEVGGVRATLCHKRLARRGIFGLALSMTQKFVLWYEHRDIPKIIRKIAARIIHVQIDVGEMPLCEPHLFADQTSPQFKISFWGVKDFGKFRSLEFIFLRPAFEVTKKIKKHLIEYTLAVARDSSRRLYDFLQLFSFVLNLGIWLFRDFQIWLGGIFPKYNFTPEMAFDDTPYPSDSLGHQMNKVRAAWARMIDAIGESIGRDKPRLWGREVIPALNIPGNKEVCSTLVRAIAEYAIIMSRANEEIFKLPDHVRISGVALGFQSNKDYRKVREEYPERFEPSLLDKYDIAMTYPAIIGVCGLWLLEYSDKKYELIRYSRDCKVGYPFALKYKDGTGIADAYPEGFDK